jgi:hypothetical protein
VTKLRLPPALAGDTGAAKRLSGASRLALGARTGDAPPMMNVEDELRTLGVAGILLTAAAKGRIPRLAIQGVKRALPS